MRLAIVVPTFPQDVASSELWLAKGLARAGHNVAVFASGHAGSRDRGWGGGDGTTRGPPEEFDFVRLSAAAPWHGEAVLPLRLSQIFDWSPDVLLIAEDYFPLSQLAAHEAHARGVRYVLTSERSRPYGPAAFRGYVRLAERTTLPRLWRSADPLTFHSRESLEYFAGLGVPRDRLRYVPSCTDVALFSPRPDGSVKPEPPGLWAEGASGARVLTIGRLHPAKGLDVLVEAVRNVREAGPPVVAAVHGRGERERELRARAQAVGLGTAFHVHTTRAPLADLPELYRSADIYAQPSLVEPFGMGVLEAMACGLPVVASATGGLNDLVEDGTTGFLVPPGDAVALAARIGELAADSSLRARFGRAGRERAVQRFALERTAAAFDELLRARSR